MTFSWKWAVAVVLAAYGGLFVASGFFESTDCANCYQAAISLHALVLAQEEFRSKDADQNGIQDYWRRDVAGLSTLAPEGKPLGLINLSTAQADRRSASAVPGGPAAKCAY